MFLPSILASNPNWVLPPLHPILVHFTAALIPASFLCDALGRLTGRESLRSAAWWMLVFGVLATPLTVLTGWIWKADRADAFPHPNLSAHQWLGTLLLVPLTALLCWRALIHRAHAAPGRGYLLLAALIVAAVVVQGHLGGVMTFAPGGHRPAGAVAPGKAPHPNEGWKLEIEPH